MNKDPLFRAATYNPDTVFPVGTKITEPQLYDGRALNYLPGNTASTPEHYLEIWQESIATKDRAYFVGANALCPFAGAMPQEFSGSLEDAPASVKEFRESQKATVYAESGVGGDVDEFGHLKPLKVPVGVSSFDLPPSVAEPEHRG